METAVEWLARQLKKEWIFEDIDLYFVEKAKEKEKQQQEIIKMQYQLFIGKVSEIIGTEKTIKLLNECNKFSNAKKNNN